jgi:hypothetical protein
MAAQIFGNQLGMAHIQDARRDRCKMEFLNQSLGGIQGDIRKMNIILATVT